MSDNLKIALTLAAAGCPTFPCYATSGPHWRDKQCLKRIAWRSEASTDPRRLATWWDMEPDALPGLPPDKAGLFVVDLDRHHEGKNGIEAWAELTAVHGELNAPTVGTPSGGMHLYFRMPAVAVTNSSGILPPGIDIRGKGGYVIAPGTTLPDGRQYYGCDIATVIRDAPEAPDWLLAMIRTKPVPDAPKNAMARLSPVAVTSTASDARVKAYAEAAFAAELATLRGTAEGRRNDTLNACAFSIGTLVGAGWIGEGEARDALTGAAVEIGLTRGEIGPTITSGLTDGMKSPRQMPEASVFDHGMGAIPESFLQSDGTLYDGETGEIVGPIRAAKIMPRPAVDWLEPGGLLGEIADWIVATTPRRPNRELAMGAAIVLIGTCLGRTMATPTRSGTHLYLVCLGKSGVGKDWPLKSVPFILEACGLGQVARGGKWKSEVALENAVADQPGQVVAIDEIGKSLFAQIMGKRAGNHQTGMANTLQELWTSSFMPFKTSGSAARSSITIHSPALSIFGASTIGEFYACLTGEAVNNGFLNRFLLIQAGERKTRSDTPAPMIVPETIKGGLLALLKTGGDMQSGGLALNLPRAPDFDQMAWAPGVDEAYTAYDEEMTAVADSDLMLGDLVSRTAEMAGRLATIHAASRAGREAVVTMDDWLWGKTVAGMSANVMREDVSTRMAENEFHSKHKLVELIVRKETERDPRGATRRDVFRRVDGRFPHTEITKILEALCAAGTVISCEAPPGPKGGRPTVRFVYVGSQEAKDEAA